MIVLFLGSSPAPVADADDPEVKLGATTAPPDVLRCVVQFRRSNDQEGRLILEGLSRQTMAKIHFMVLTILKFQKLF